MMYVRNVILCRAKHLRNYIKQEIGYNAEFQFNYDNDTVRATFTCSDDYADTNITHNDDDLEAYIIRKYGAFIVKENQAIPLNFAMDMKKIAEVLTNPKLKRR